MKIIFNSLLQFVLIGYRYVPPFLLKEKVEPKVQGEFDAVTEL
jgi:hypothetical protein